jgi:hypothetical protein
VVADSVARQGTDGNRAVGTGWFSSSPLDNVIVVAEAAVTADDSDAHAHLALFCALARSSKSPASVWRSFPRLQRVKVDVVVVAVFDRFGRSVRDLIESLELVSS